MPCLIPEILQEIGKKLIKDGDSDAIIKSSLSGKESLRAMNNVFTSVKHLELFDDHFVIGWDDQSFEIKYQNNKSSFKFLLHCVGSSVISLSINYYLSNSQQAFYQPIFDQIISMKQLVSFSISPDNWYSAKTFLNEFLPIFASTLKNVSLSSFCMTEIFRDSFNLDSLTIWDRFGFRLAAFCCKTTSISFTDKDPFCLKSLEDLLPPNDQISPALLSIKELIFDNATSWMSQLNHFGLKKVMKYFPLLELIAVNIKFAPKKKNKFFKHVVQFHVSGIYNAVNIPPKLVITFSKLNAKNYDMKDVFQNVCRGFEYDPSNSGYCCFRKNLQCRGGASTIYEVRIPK